MFSEDYFPIMDNKNILLIGIAIALIAISIYFGISYGKKYDGKKQIETFTNTTTTIKNKYGNVLYSENISNIKNNTKIVLPGRFRITGIQVNNTQDKESEENEYSNQYKVYIADNEDDISNPDIRKLVSCNDNGKSILNINTLYNNPLNFEKDSNSLFVGKVLLIERDNTNDDILDIRPLPPTLNIKVLGLEPFASNFNSFNKMINVTIPDNKNIKVGYIHILNTNTNFNNIRVKYSNTIDNNSNKYSIAGPIKLGYQINSENPFIFFTNPLIVNKLYLSGINNLEYELYGSETISNRDINNFKLQQQKFDEKHMIIGGEKCPNIGEMINKQLQAQQICEALEYKDKARNKKLAYEKDKVYLGKLAQQDKEIIELENIVKQLIQKKNNRITKNQGNNIEELDKELRRVEKVREEAEEYLKSNKLQHKNLRMQLNVDPELKNITSFTN